MWAFKLAMEWLWGRGRKYNPHDPKFSMKHVIFSILQVLIVTAVLLMAYKSFSLAARVVKTEKLLTKEIANEEAAILKLKKENDELRKKLMEMSHKR